MNLKENKKEILGIITFTCLLCFALFHISEIGHFLTYLFSILMPFILGLAIAFILNILLSIVENKIFGKINTKQHPKWARWKRPICLLTTFLILLSFLALLIYLVVPELKNTIKIFSNNLPQYQEQMIDFAENIGISSKDMNAINNHMVELKEFANNLVKNNSNQILDFTIGFASGLLSGVMNFILGIVFAIYVLLQKEQLQKQSKKVLYAFIPKVKMEHLRKIMTLSNKTFANFISGQFLEAVIIGLLCFLGMLILGIPYAPTIAVLVGFTALIPVFGAFIGTGIGAFLIFMIDPWKALIFILFILALQQLEGNLIYPKVVGKSVGLPGIWVMVAVTIGASSFGILGMLISVPLCSILYSMLQVKVNDQLKKKKITEKEWNH